VKKTETISEGQFQAALVKAANAAERKTRLDRINSGTLAYTRKGAHNVFRGAAAGTGDLVGYVRGFGWHLEVECKAATGKKRKAQLARAAAAKEAGWIYVVVRVVAGVGLTENVDRAVRVVDAAIAQRAEGSRA
jgi:hypothetical protein